MNTHMHMSSLVRTGGKRHSRHLRTLAATLVTLALAGFGLAQTPSLEVSAQPVSAGGISLDAVTLAQDGFVVVHAYDTANELVLTPPLGVIYLKAGEHIDVLVTLDQELLAEYGYGAEPKNVLPMLHLDPNSNMIYEFPDGGDVPVMVNEQMVVADMAITLDAMSFMDHGAGLTPGLLAASQDLTSVEFVLDSVTLAADGFVVVHAYNTAGELVLTPPLGVTYLAAGTHQDVRVGLDTELLAQYGYNATSKDVLPMLHIDANANMAYEFPEGGDVPVMIDDEMVVLNVPIKIAW